MDSKENSFTTMSQGSFGFPNNLYNMGNEMTTEWVENVMNANAIFLFRLSYK